MNRLFYLRYLITIVILNLLLMYPGVSYGGTFAVTNTNDSGDGSLRRAIIGANTTAGTDTIIFNIPGTGPHTIQLSSPLPPIQESLFIDGYSQPGSVKNSNPFGQGVNSVIMIIIDGTNAGIGIDGLRILKGNCIIQGLQIRKFSDAGIELLSEGNIISGNFIFNNGGDGLQIRTSHNTIGGTDPEARNLISGNGGNGIRLSVAADSNKIQGNYIGVSLDGTKSLPNQLNGIVIFNARDNQIGGKIPGSGNVISGSAQADGVLIASNDSSATGNKVQGNRIGTDAAGLNPLKNARHGVWVRDTPDNLIGGTEIGSGNVISGNDSLGVKISGRPATGNLVQGNLIGTDVTGTIKIGNGRHGILLENAPNNLIGGTVTGAGNIISGNRIAGVVISKPLSTGNLIQGNFIGTDSTGTVAVGNGMDGVAIVAASENTIGGTLPGARNVISANQRYGVNIGKGMVGTVDNNLIQGNYIGTDITGTLPLGNGNSGVFVTAASNTVIENNVIADNFEGIRLDGRDQPTDSTFIRGNLIGLDATGMSPLGNALDGIIITQSSHNFIGGTTATSRNVISANGQHGIQISSFGKTATDNKIKGNFIGLDITGSKFLPNGDPETSRGIFIVDSGVTNTIIGGVEPGAGNAIVGHDVNIVVSSNNNLIQGNFIGTDLSGNFTQNSGRIGVWLIDASNNVIGGSENNAGNLIAGHSEAGILIFEATEGSKANLIEQNIIRDNGTDGIGITGAQSINNKISENSIFNNGALGINLGSDEVTQNDVSDLDIGPNNLQNFPLLVSAERGNSLTIQGSLGSLPSTQFVIEFFANSTCDPSNFGEGMTFIGSTVLNTDANGNAFFTVTFNNVNISENFITATATDNSGNTSEFSQCIAIGGPPAAPSLISPLNNTTDLPGSVTFRWSSVGGAEAYHLQVSTDVNFTQLIFEDSTLTDTVQTVKSLAQGTQYYWRVRARNAFGWSGYSEVFTFSTGQVPSAPVLLFPGDGSMDLPTEVTLRWGVSAGAEAYHLQVSTDVNFTQLVFEDSTLTDTVQTVKSLAQGTQYYWRVRARNAFGWGVFSETFNFTTGAPPARPLLLLPALNDTVRVFPIKFVWKKVQKAQKYHFQIAKDENFTELVLEDSSLVDTTKEIQTLKDSTTYFWRVRAGNSFGWGLFADQFTFTLLLKTTSVESINSDLPQSFILKQNYPNPFNPKTTIVYALPKSTEVSLIIYDLLGHQIANLVKEHQEAGLYRVIFDASNLPSGLYFYRLKAGKFVQTKRMLLLK
ncbi:MAG: T9SS C-terminal target domain-containing protein [Calditrichaeota bacterium]|nr:MAG: T9SS C-terminal target domain-containing protein [Calditrichota bacterium]